MAPSDALATGQGPPLQALSIPDSITTDSSIQCKPALSTLNRPQPTDLACAIVEETESESEAPNEPITPVSGRQSREFTAVRSQDNSDTEPAFSGAPASNTLPVIAKHPHRRPEALVINTNGSVSPAAPRTTCQTQEPNPRSSPVDQENLITPGTSRRPTFSSTAGSIRKSFSSVFRRNTGKELSNKDSYPASAAASNRTSKDSPSLANLDAQSKTSSRRHSSVNKSGSIDLSKSQQSPTSPVDMAFLSRDRVQAANGTANARANGTANSSPNGMANGTTLTLEEAKRKTRASTGFSIKDRAMNRAVNFVSSNVPGRDKDKRKQQKRRANSFNGREPEQPLPADRPDLDSPFVPAERLPWPYPPEQGTGAKARRMSLSLPDDFTVDVAELSSEYEYLHKFFGRHGKHLGKGATSKVTLMNRKGCQTELYAVKEFRGKSQRESQDDYEKKIKSEYSIAKSLHHPNIVETIRLCTDHGRWNHVMEYCAEGDLFGLVEKGYLKQEGRMGDRNCLFKQLIQGVNYLHSNGIAHRDIKLENLLITKDSKLKITDFGVSEVFSGIHPGLREAGGVCGKNMGELRLCSPGICGSEPYIAPEVLAKEQAYDPRALDVWSSAIIMINLIFGGNLWSKAARSDPSYLPLANGWAGWDNKHAGDPDANPTETDYPHVAAFDRFVKPPALRRLLLRMLNPDPAKRISITEVVSNRWMKNVECCQLESYEDPSPIDVSKKDAMKCGTKKIYCHNHLPPLPTSGAPSIGIMPGKPGY